MTEYSLVIRGGTVVDGTGGAPYKADVALQGDIIAAIGAIAGKGAEEIDATGLYVTPGFVDPHTHYDGQVTWEDRLTPSSEHGVTTGVMGNCGIGFAPARPEHRETVMKLMAGVEDVPEEVMEEGLPWNWESFPQYMDALAERRWDIDMACQMPHNTLRLYVMGSRVAEAPTPGDLAEMRRLTKEAVQAGAIGFSTTRNFAHRFRDGTPAPSTTTDAAELLEISKALTDAGTGMFQVIPNSSESPSDEEFALIKSIADTCHRPITFSLFTGSSVKGGPEGYLRGLAQAAQDHQPIYGQYFPRPVGMMFGFDLSYNPFSLNPSWKTVAGLPLAEKMRHLRDPAFRKQLISEEPQDPNPFFLWVIKQSHLLFPLGNPPNYNPSPEDSIKARAERLGVDEREMVYEELLRQNGQAILFCPLGNTANNRFDAATDLFGHPNTIFGLGDGGAHYGMICDAAYPTYVLEEYVARQGRLPVETAISMLTREPAQAVGLQDRGLLKPGYKADLNIIDLASLHLHAPLIKRDLPAHGRRLTQRAEGYEATIVSGVVTCRKGRPTGALPGRLVRHMRAAPAALERDDFKSNHSWFALKSESPSKTLT